MSISPTGPIRTFGPGQASPSLHTFSDIEDMIGARQSKATVLDTTSHGRDPVMRRAPRWKVKYAHSQSSATIARLRKPIKK